MDAPIVPITDFIRRIGDYADMLPNVTKLIITRDGRPFATFQATPEEKNARLIKLFGTWKGSLFDNDMIWKAVAVRRNRKKPIKI